MLQRLESQGAGGETVASEAANAPQRRSVVSRRKVLDGITVKVRVPKRAWLGSYPCPATGNPVPYYGSAYTVRDGVVHCFFHNGIEPGEICTADVEIWEKELDDGSCFLYVDYRPSQEVMARHRVVVMNRADVPRDLDPSWTRVETPAPLKGTIVVMPHGEKVNPVVILPHGKKVNSVDEELQKLLDNGWRETRRNNTFVFLEREIDGRMKLYAHRLK